MADPAAALTIQTHGSMQVTSPAHGWACDPLDGLEEEGFEVIEAATAEEALE
jgi:hypothetical protein